MGVSNDTQAFQHWNIQANCVVTRYYAFFCHSSLALGVGAVAAVIGKGDDSDDQLGLSAVHPVTVNVTSRPQTSPTTTVYQTVTTPVDVTALVTETLELVTGGTVASVQTIDILARLTYTMSLEYMNWNPVPAGSIVRCYDVTTTWSPVTTFMCYIQAGVRPRRTSRLLRRLNDDDIDKPPSAEKRRVPPALVSVTTRRTRSADDAVSTFNPVHMQNTFRSRRELESGLEDIDRTVVGKETIGLDGYPRRRDERTLRRMEKERKRSFHIQKSTCANCGYPAAKVRKYNWSEKAKRRKTTGTGRMRYLKTVDRKFQNGFQTGTPKGARGPTTA
ncbi:hypothetical protein ZTR_07976 [Talaromyces verruculosus]|nr:hypothetical protein ZTR_07976 [Talaromyces verruculosus]